MRGTLRPSSISSYKTGGGRSPEAEGGGGGRLFLPDCGLRERQGESQVLGAETAKLGAFPHTHPPSSSLSSQLPSPGRGKAPRPSPHLFSLLAGMKLIIATLGDIVNPWLGLVTAFLNDLHVSDLDPRDSEIGDFKLDPNQGAALYLLQQE